MHIYLKNFRPDPIWKWNDGTLGFFEESRLKVKRTTRTTRRWVATWDHQLLVQNPYSTNPPPERFTELHEQLNSTLTEDVKGLRMWRYSPSILSISLFSAQRRIRMLRLIYPATVCHILFASHEFFAGYTTDTTSSVLPLGGNERHASFSVCNYNDGNKTKMLRPRPRPVNQQQECLTEKKLFCCNTRVCYQKITWCKNVAKVMTSNVWHCFCTYCTKEYMCLLHFSILMSHSVLSRTTVLEARPKV